MTNPLKLNCIVALDDGYAVNKCAFWRDGKIASVSVPSAAVRGRVMSDADDRSAGAYNVGTDAAGRAIEFTIASRGIGGDIEQTRVPDYAVSDLNRALVHHTLIRAGFGGRKIVLGTALPMRGYFEDGAQDAKKASLARPVVSLGGEPIAAPVHQHVYAQALSAWVDHVIDENGQPISDTHDDGEPVDRRDLVIGIIDVGGRTTDFAVVWVEDSTPVLARGRSGSVDLGMLDVIDALLPMLQQRFNIKDINPVQLEAAVRGGTLKLWGKPHDVSQEIAAAATETARRLVTEVQRRIGSGANLDRLLFVGGGSVVLREALTREYPHVYVAEQADLANARGMLKYMSFIDPTAMAEAQALGAGDASPGGDGVVSLSQRRGSGA